MMEFLKLMFYKFFPIRLYLVAAYLRRPDSKFQLPSINAYTFFQLLGRRKRTFVQIGANDGVKNDPINEFVVKSSWEGVLVEPLPYFYGRLRANYTGIEGLSFENSGISDAEGVMEFYYLPKEYNSPEWVQQIGSFSRESILLNLKELPELIPKIAIMKIPVLTLIGLFEKYKIGSLDLLLIDAEGFESRILACLTQNNFLPRFIFYEWGCMNVDENEKLMRDLKVLGYSLFDCKGDILATK